MCLPRPEPGRACPALKLIDKEVATPRCERAVAEYEGRVEDEPLETLELHPLLEIRRTGGRLSPGELLSVFPPFCTAEAREGVSLRAIDTRERLDFLCDLSARVQHAP